jgi:transcriptional regulator with XRE-family HTH domain
MLSFLGPRLRQARLNAGLSQVQIAQACRVSQPTISYWERPSQSDHCNELGLESLITIAKLTGKPISWFLEEDTDQSSVRITVEEVEAEAEWGHQLAVMVGPYNESYPDPPVDAYRLHLALGIERPYEQWLQQVLDTHPFVADQDYFMVSTHRHFWSMEVAKALASSVVTPRGFAVWRMLIRLGKHSPSALDVQPEIPAASPLAVEPVALNVTPTEFIEVVLGCVKIAHQMGLYGEPAQQAVDQAATRLTGCSPRQLMGIAA